MLSQLQKAFPANCLILFHKCDLEINFPLEASYDPHENWTQYREDRDNKERVNTVLFIYFSHSNIQKLFVLTIPPASLNTEKKRRKRRSGSFTGKEKEHCSRKKGGETRP